MFPGAWLWSEEGSLAVDFESSRFAGHWQFGGQSSLGMPWGGLCVYRSLGRKRGNEPQLSGREAGGEDGMVERQAQVWPARSCLLHFFGG